MEYPAEVTDIATSDTYYIHILNIYNWGTETYKLCQKCIRYEGTTIYTTYSNWHQMFSITANIFTKLHLSCILLWTYAWRQLRSSYIATQVYKENRFTKTVSIYAHINNFHVLNIIIFAQERSHLWRELFFKY